MVNMQPFLCLALLAAAAAALPVAAAAQAPAERTAGDPFAALVREALQHNLLLAGERRAAEREEAAVRESGGRFLPSLSVQARYTEQSGALDVGDLVNPAYRALNQLTGTTRFPTDVSATLPVRQETKLRLVQPLWQPALAPALDATRHARDARAAATGAVARQVAAGAQLALVGVGRAARVVELYETTLPLVREHLRVAERLVESGAATPEIVSRAAADLAEVEQALADARRQRADAVRRLNDVLGRPLDAEAVPLPDSLLVAPPVVSLDAALASAFGAREELHQADAVREAAGARLRLAQAATLPGVSLALDYGVQGDRYRFRRDADVATASLVVSWDLFTGGQATARREQAALGREEAALRQQDVRRRVELEVRTAHDAALVAHAAIATADTRHRAAERTYTLVRRRWEEGLAPQLELVEARAALTTAGLNAILTRYAYAVRHIELERAAALRDLSPVAPQGRLHR